MKTWVLLFFSSFTLGFCLSYLISNPPENSPVAIHLNVAHDGQDGMAVSIDDNGATSRRTSFGNPGNSARLPVAYASAREATEIRRAGNPASSRDGTYQPGLNTPDTPKAPEDGPGKSGELAGLLLDAARHELDGRTDQRDLILASLFEAVIRSRISESARPGNETAEARTAARKPVEKKQVVTDRPWALTTPRPAPPGEPAAPGTAAGPEAALPTPARAPSAKETNDPADTKAAFRMVSVTFASEIQGPGDYKPLGNRVFNPGDHVLIYGEFEGFEEEPPRTKEDPTYTRSFSGRLKLVNDRSEVLDTFTFLNPSRVAYRPQQRTRIVNFWARYRFPEDLPPGTYKVKVEGSDLIGENEATATLGLQVRTHPPLPPLKPGKLDNADLETLPPYEEPEASPGVERNNTADSP